MKTLSELNSMYVDSVGIDEDIYSHFRTNILLFIGDHYVQKNQSSLNRTKDMKQKDAVSRIRLTKNHIQKICTSYINNIIQYCPSVGISPFNENELHDQKVAELHSAVKRDIQDKESVKELTEKLAADLVIVGECHCKISYNYDVGPVIALEPELDEQGEVKLNKDGEPDVKEVRAGKFVFERIYAFDLLRDKRAKELENSSFIGHRKLVDVKELKAKFPSKADMIKADPDETYQIFNGANGEYSQSKDQAMVREYYFRKSAEFPEGYYYITISSEILDEGELPLGIFPIVSCGWNQFPTSPRSHSIIKTLRPYQVEVNRSASAIAEHQLSLGSDKLLIQKGTKIAHGGYLPGIRGIQYTGIEPKILAGRSGAHYLDYMNSQIQEMYMVANLELDSQQNDKMQNPYLELFKSIREKKKFVVYTNKFEAMLVKMWKKVFKMAKEYYHPNMVIKSAGRKEAVNVAEFKSIEDIGYEIKVEPMSDDVETKFGRILTFQNILQYMGGQLTPTQVGVVLRNMPYGNVENAFNELTLDYDNATNDILALDRGEEPVFGPYEKHEYVIERLMNRMKQSDYRYLPEEIQQRYMQKLTMHENIFTQQKQAIENAQKGLVPAGGFLVTCNASWTEPTTGKVRRIKLPSETLRWVMGILEQQGAFLAQQAQLPEGAQADIAAQGQGGEENVVQMPQVAPGPGAQMAN